MKESSVKKNRAVYQLKITLRDIEPPIWRRIQIWEDTKLPQLHNILQMLFLWEDYHLHDFHFGKRTYSVPDPDDGFNERKILDEHGVPLNRLMTWVGDEFVYEYDFGDSWLHDVVLEAILLAEPETFYPRCIEGARSGPPEDAGGPGGYENFLEARSDPEHEEYETCQHWHADFQPEAFSLKDINAALHRRFHRRRPARMQPPANAGIRLQLTVRERQLILKNTLIDSDVVEALKADPPACTPEQLDDLLGHIASAANAAPDNTRFGELDRLYRKLDRIQKEYFRTRHASQ